MRKIASAELVAASIKNSAKDPAVASSTSVKAGDIVTDKIPPLPSKKAEAARRDYGIEEAIKLMRRMPEADMRVLAKVIKECLESTNIRIANIIKDAETKEGRLEEQIKKLDSEIDDLESMITHRKEAIQNLVQDLDETRHVKNQLSLAEGSHDLDIEASPKAGKQGQSDLADEKKLKEQSAAMLLESLLGEPHTKSGGIAEKSN
ncbi:MAG: hypothetical protein ACOH5I_14275 [Oligoflexus sp.]